MDKVAGSGNDEFYTPLYAIIPIEEHVKSNSVIWCPFDTKDSLFVKRFEYLGHKVIFSHISTGTDFFDCEIPNCDYIISNPPYSLKYEVLKRLFEIGKPFAMLLGVAGLFESQKRYNLFKGNEFQIIYMNKRISYFKDYKDAKPSLNPPFSSVYICSKMLNKQIVFKEVDKKMTNKVDDNKCVVSIQERREPTMAINYSTGQVVDIARNPSKHSADVQKDVAKRYSLIALRAGSVEGLLEIIAAIPASTSTRTIATNIEGGVENVETPQEAEDNEPTGDEIENQEQEMIDNGETEAEQKKRLANEKRNLKRKEKRQAEKDKKAADAAGKAAPKTPAEQADLIDEPDGFADEPTEKAAADMSGDELKAACKKYGVKLVAGMTKADAVAAVEEKQAPAGDDWAL